MIRKSALLIFGVTFLLGLQTVVLAEGGFLSKDARMSDYEFPEAVKDDLIELSHKKIFVIRQGEKVEIMIPSRVLFDGKSTHFNESSVETLEHLKNVIRIMNPKSMMIFGFYSSIPDQKIDPRGIARTRLDEMNDYLWGSRLGGAAIITQTRKMLDDHKMSYWKEEVEMGDIILLKFINYT